jgi:hypothetical protein
MIFIGEHPKHPAALLYLSSFGLPRGGYINCFSLL